MTATAAPARTRAGPPPRFPPLVAERHPVALRAGGPALEKAIGGEGIDERDAGSIDALRAPLRRLLPQTLSDFLTPDATAAQKLRGEVPETTPGVGVGERLQEAIADVVDAADGFLRREAICASLTNDEKRDILRGMLLTRATDNRLKQ